jgi:Cu/Ag efflux protein CusF
MNKPSLIILSLLGAVSLPSGAQQQPAAGGAAVMASAPGKATIAQTVAVTATVEAIDVASRQVTLKGPRGNSVTMTVDPQARNLAQVKVGDLVVARYYEALSLTLKKDGKELRGSTDTSDAARTAAGERPGAAATRQVEVTADVIAVDPKTQTVTLKGSMRTVELKIPDPGQFKLVKVGDQIQAVYTEALVVAVEPAKKQ